MEGKPDDKPFFHSLLHCLSWGVALVVDTKTKLVEADYRLSVDAGSIPVASTILHVIGTLNESLRLLYPSSFPSTDVVLQYFPVDHNCTSIEHLDCCRRCALHIRLVACLPR